MSRQLAVGLFLVLAGGIVGFRPVAALCAAAQTRQEDKSASRFWKLRSWATAVEEHQPGEFDPPAFFINDWPPSDLQAVVADLKVLVRFLTAARESFLKSGRLSTARYLGRTITTSEVQELLGLTDDEVFRGDANRVLKRGALLHADVAMLAPPRNQQEVNSSPSGAQGVVFVFRDGRLQGVEFAGVHWTIGRALLDEVNPDPSRDEMVRLWYHATAAYLQTHNAFTYADPHLDRARRLLPRDANILLYSGSMHESLATPRMQVTVGPAETLGFISSIRSTRAELQQAETFFRQALRSDPGLTEARIRLGRVLELLGHPREAAAELRQAATGNENELLLYYAELFLGQAEQALGHREAARDAFELAAKLYPRAQSPRLALSQLARRYGDRSSALGAIQEVLALPSDENTREDPWWYYDNTHALDADTLLDELYEPFLAENPQ